MQELSRVCIFVNNDSHGEAAHTYGARACNYSVWCDVGNSPPMLTTMHHNLPPQLALRPTGLPVTKAHPGTRDGQRVSMSPIYPSVLGTLLQQLGGYVDM